MRTVAYTLRALLALLLVFCLTAYLAGVLASLAVDGDRMLQKMEAYSDTALSGLDSSEYPALATALTDYLRGKVDSPQVEVQKHGLSQAAFSQRELQHLGDIQKLIGLANGLRLIALAMVALALALFFVLRSKASREFLALIKPHKALGFALGLLFCAATGLVIWGMVDFNSLFYAFHKVLFTNDLWLLDPKQDLLMQLMPGEFFVSYAKDAIKSSAIVVLSLPLAAYAFSRAGKETA